MPADPFALAESPLVRRAVSVLGWLSVATTLVLSAPGVVATANGEPAAEATGPACGVAEQSGETAVVHLTRIMEQIRADAARQADSSDEVVELDTRGYSYRPAGPAPPRADSRR